MDRLTRTSALDIELRGDGRTLAGIAVPYGQPAQINDSQGRYSETFQRGAFARTIAERGDRIKLLSMHDSASLPIGRVTSMREDTAGLFIEARVSETDLGDQVLTLVRDGAIDGFSIGFAPVRDLWNANRSAVTRLEAKLFEVSTVAFPSFDDARITALRHTPAPIPASHDPLVWAFKFRK